ncbi:hypothetical protein BCR34DRAFT_330834 [Clohesyomyces aquaticus]|uniref:Uncharacterized protein n=1 Tax=Clohesyomyces aquaticus TaxID=1231657 RepID=A0A1Y1ZLV8_9PLEO|nr:hypothetical protein BCR34DRAFT_330834 [Clohesyomyces aquaticus]
MIAAVTYSTRDGADVRIRADNLVIAAGAWTERLFDKLFPRSDVDLQFDAPSAKDYLVLQNQLVPLVENSINKVSLDDVVGHQLDFIGRLDETIWVGSELDATPILPPPGTVIHPDQKTIEELYEYSKRWVRTDFRPGYDPENEYPEDEYPEEEFLEEYNPELEGPEEEEDEPPPPQPAIRRSSASTPEPRPLYSPRIVQRVRTFLPRTVSGCPVIAEVTTAKLITGVPFNPPGHRSGVFINSGHYIDGLYQAIGSGLLMAHLILGRKPELDMEHFGLHYKSERWRNWSDLGERDEVSAKRLKEEEV